MKRSLRNPLGISISIALALLLVTWLVYVDGGTEGSLIHFYYIPIVAASYLLGDIGGIVTAFAAAVLAAIPPLRVSEGGHASQPLKDIIIRAILFYFIGLITSRLFSKLEERREDAASLLEVSRSVSASLRTSEVLRTIAETAVHITAAKACTIRLLNREQDELTTVASYGLSLDYLAKGPLRLSDSPVDREAVAGRVMAILDVGQDPRFRYRDEARAEGLVSLLCLPLRRHDNVFGVLRVYSQTRHQWSRRERRMLQAFADQASIAIHNARLHEELQRNYWETVSALARAIEAKDPHTLGHSERVTNYALQLGQALELNPERMETLRFAATLHDIGKIGLTDESLARSTHLDMSDEVMVRMHPLIGISILQPVDFLAPALPAVRYHHERWDGAGYPEGLAGEKIPLLARLLAVVNVYDHLRTGSPGRPGLTQAEAARELRRFSGAALDPELTQRFLDSLGIARTQTARESPGSAPAPDTNT
jgi:HD-GYP domain-containing protein (c-di-GMP phosphodiesterase class II)